MSFEGTPVLGQREPSMFAPIQKFRWVHFPFDADKSGDFTYLVTPVFMNEDSSLRYGATQAAAIELNRETYPGVLNVSFTRGKPTARVYLGSYNFSGPADTQNGENLPLITDRRIATSYAIEAVRIFDHYEFRLQQQIAATAATTLQLHKPPQAGEMPWFDEDFTNANKILDRKLFA